jgi:penicillin amidase
LRTTVLVLIALLAVPAAAVALTAPHASAQLPNPLGRAVNVTIERDAYGVPHVYANDAYSLFFGNGYAQAQDRFFQMDVLRHVGRGQATQMLGPGYLAMDLAARRDLYTEAERTQQWLGLPEDQRTALVGFADGVNAWLNETKLHPNEMPAEELALGRVAPEPWIPEDTVSVADYLLSIFGVGSGDQELSNAQLLKQLATTLPADQVEGAFHDLVWMYDNSSYSTIPASEGTYDSTEQPLAFADIPPAQWAATWAAANATPFGDVQCVASRAGVQGDCAASLSDLAQSTVDAGMPLKWGSNAALVSPALSRSGGALLLGGPQMAYYNPMIPYEVALHGAGYDALGMGVGGAPGVIIGRAQHYSWTVTSGDGDQVDVVAERLVPGQTEQYYNGSTGAATNMDCRTETYYGLPTAVDQEPPILATQRVCRTAEGPVFAENVPAGYAFVRQATTRGDELRSGLLWLTLGQESTLSGFESHMETFRFTFNFNYADDQGNIAYFHWGANPVRASGYDPRFPRVAGDAEAWQGVRTGSQMPHVVNPAQGYTVNWNNLPEQGFSAGAAREQWGSVHRAELYDRAIRDAIAASPDHKLGVPELMAIHERISMQNPFAYRIAPFVIGAAEHDADPQVQAAVQALRDWRDAGYTWQDDGNGPAITRAAGQDDRTYAYPGFAVYEQWRTDMQDALLKDELGPLNQEMNFDPPTSSDPHAADAGRSDNKEVPLLNAYLARNEHDWCDNVTTPQVETCGALTLATLKQALGELTARYGTANVSAWHEPIHHDKFVALSGGPSWLIPMVNRPSFVHLYDWGTGYAASNLPPGTNQSWQPAAFAQYEMDGSMPDAHHDDQLRLYVDFQYKPAQMTPASVESVTHLTS